MSKLLVASHNQKKLKELQKILKETFDSAQFRKIELVSLSQFPNVHEVIEDGKTFEENAIKKAIGYAKQTGLLTLADDSGLCVDALNGEPGIFSARYAGEEKDDVANCVKVINQIREVTESKRTGRFECVIAIADPEKVIGTSRGVVEGMILPEMRGEGGFGYDPLFYYPPFKQTFGEVDFSRKAQVSHRSKALKLAIQILSNYLSDNKL